MNTGGSVVKNLPVSAGDPGDMGSIPRSVKSHGGGNGNLLQYSCLENPMYREICQAIVHTIAQSRTRLNQLSMHSDTVRGKWCLQ